ncbi:hypothetical protein M422DRAFT_267975 [Sphaerobolus stellatus SS14]|uniref:Helitron helicase-like domain-containing protein n=1 Tax=Sphaerobolus stellatus (strain SS14) TaxID=990650 RepID=A0A0C9TL40_SPHS4|nr:hypothetical protein M422DRAFT_267975 [Sphaerobolus stellatus SS14]
MLDARRDQGLLRWFLYDENKHKSRGRQHNVPTYWIQQVQADLQEVDPYVQLLRQFCDIEEYGTAALELTERSCNGDFAALLHASNTTNFHPRSILIWHNGNEWPSFISIYSHHYEPLQYPLLFPHGTPGWGLPWEVNGDTLDPDEERGLGFTQMDWYWNHLLTDTRFLRFGCLISEYICDMYSRIEEQHLQYILHSQKDNNTSGHMNSELPVSFLGSRCWSSENTADGLALAHTYGHGTFFVTFTMNPDWPEIRSQLTTGQTASDVPLVIARAFKQ